MQIRTSLLLVLASGYYPQTQCLADTAPKTYSKAPMGAYEALMDDRLTSNKYQAPVWNLNSALNTPDWLWLGVEQRTRYETKDGTFKVNTSNGDQQIDLQTTLSIKATLDKWQVLTEIMDSRALGADTGISKSPGQAINSNVMNQIDFVQGYVSWADKKAFADNIGLEVKAGRQTIDMGSRRLIARPYFRNTVNSFTGVKLRALEPEKWQFTAFGVMPVLRLPSASNLINNETYQLDQEADKTWLSGGALELYKLYGSVNAEVYLYNLDENNSYNNLTRQRHYLTPGIRFFSKPSKGHFDFQAEGIGQFGTVRYAPNSTKDQTHEAWSEHVEIGYSFDSTWLQRFMLEYDYATGNNNPGPNQSSDTRFDPLYGTSVPDFGPTGIYGAFQRSNINSPGYKLTLTPTPAIQISLQHRLIWLASASDCWGGAACGAAPASTAKTPTTVNLPPGNTNGSTVGSQLGISGRYDVNSSLSIDTGWFHLFKDQFAKSIVEVRNTTNASSNVDVDYVYIQSQLRF